MNTRTVEGMLAPTAGGVGRAYQAGLSAPYATKPPMIAGLPGSAARKMFRKGQQDARIKSVDQLPRSSRANVRNPLLALPAMQELLALDTASRAAVRALLLNIRLDARDRAEKCWRTHKAPMAAYWKVVSVYAGHTARALQSDEVRSHE